MANRDLIDFAHQWAEALTAGTATPAVQLVSEQQGCDGVLFQGRSLTGTPLHVGSHTFARGLATHADSRVRVVCAAPARRFRARVGVDDNACTRLPQAHRARLVFSVEAAGRVLWSGPPVQLEEPAVAVDVDLGGAREFHLVVKSLGAERSALPAPWYGHGDWLEAEVEFQGGAKHRVGGSLAESRLPRGPAFSFCYGGRRSAELLPGWTVERRRPKPWAGGTDHGLTFTDPATGLEVRVEARAFAEFPAVEWLLRLRNTGKADTPILEDLRPLDYVWPAPVDVQMCRSRGSDAREDDFFYTCEPLARGQTAAMAAGGGRSSSGHWLPFFNLQNADNGLILGIGWSGQWAAEIARDAADRVTLKAGQELVRLTLHPGEEIRTPRILLLSWEGEALDGHNLLRRFLLAHHTPQQNGRPIEAPLSAAMWGGMKEQSQLDRIRMIREQKLPYDVYWVDAGWYGPPEAYAPDADEYDPTWPQYVGDWRVNPACYPRGLKPVSDAARAAGMKFLLWVDGERATDRAPVVREHPEWFLPMPSGVGSWPADLKFLLLNLGLPAAREWITETVDRLIREQGIDAYRHDFNTDPLEYWRAADAPDRQGMTEIRHIEGLYAFWDELLRRHPGLFIDNCASGGRRIDFEILGRGLHLWRTDYTVPPTFDPVGNQVHTMGLSHWVPLSGAGVQVRPGDTYNFRSGLSAALVFQLFWFERTPISEDYPFEWHRRMMADFRRARPFFYGDYYPLVPISNARDVWAAYQFHRPDLNAGIVVAFRREQCPFRAADFRLRGLDPAATYTLEDADDGPAGKAAGAALAEPGLRVTLDTLRSSKLIFYRKSG